METIDIYRAAQLLIKSYKSAAFNEAKERAAEFRLKGDEVGACIWARISQAVTDLSSKQPLRGENTQ